MVTGKANKKYFFCKIETIVNLHIVCIYVVRHDRLVHVSTQQSKPNCASTKYNKYSLAIAIKRINCYANRTTTNNRRGTIMEHLKDIYIAISQRLDRILQRKDLSPEDLAMIHEPLTLLRLDLEQVIQLVAKEKNISYDQIAQSGNIDFEQAAIDISDTLWSPKKKD